MKIGILATHPIQYNSPFFVELAKKCEIKVFYCYKPDEDKQGEGFGVKFKWDIPLLEGYDYKFLNDSNQSYDNPSICEEIKKENFDIFITYGWWFKTSKYALKFCNENNIPIYVRGDSQLQMNSSIKNILKKLIYPRFLKRFNGFLSPGKRFKQYLSYYGINDEKICFVPHTVNNDFFKKEFNIRMNNENEKITEFIYCGKLIDIKKVKVFLKAIEKLDQSKVKGKIIGTGKLKKSLQNYVKKHKLNIEFLGFVNQKELPTHYAQADCLVLCSRSETWGLVVNESFACGTPAIVSQTCGCTPDLIEEGKTGYSYPTGEIDELVSKMKLIMERNKDSFKLNIEKKLQIYNNSFATNNLIEYLESKHNL